MKRRQFVQTLGAGSALGAAALMSGCAVGTIKSRVNRARNKLLELMALDGTTDLDPDHQTQTTPPIF